MHISIAHSSIPDSLGASAAAGLSLPATIAAAPVPRARPRATLWTVGADALVLQTLGGLIESEHFAVNLAGCVSMSAAGALFDRGVAPDVLLLDVSHPAEDGWRLVDIVGLGGFPTAVVVVSSWMSEYTLSRCDCPPVAGLIDGQTAVEGDWREFLCAACAGRGYHSGAAEAALRVFRQKGDSWMRMLSDCERRLLPLLGAGMSNEAIATRVGISASTAQWHRKRVMAKLGVRSIAELMRWALKHGLLRPVDVM